MAARLDSFLNFELLERTKFLRVARLFQINVCVEGELEALIAGEDGSGEVVSPQLLLEPVECYSTQTFMTTH